MKTLITIIVLLLSTTINAQSVKQDANGNYVAIHTTKISDKTDSSTGKTYTDSKR